MASRLDSPEVQAVRANQQVLEGGQLSLAELDQRTRAVYRNAARAQFEFFHYLNDLQKMAQLVELDSTTQEGIRLTQTGNQGIIVVCPHTGNFELAGRAMGVLGLQVQILAEPTQRADYQLQNRLRRRAGLDMTPISIETLRAATRRLRAGGSVLTGVDWPVADPRFCPVFCGRPSHLPTGHVRLAIQTHAPVIVLACHRRSDGIYQMSASAPIPMQDYGDPTKTILRNTETVLIAVEQFIRRDPEQWLMFHQVWD
jgi:KDO2-lipid IV(A) lauroyltransferase